ncbi:hypothetical protein GGER_07370 [Serratia rubidaea]
MHNKRIVITPGEPAGVGPDLVVALAQQAWPVELVVCADPALLLERARQLRLPLTLRDYQPDAPAQPAGGRYADRTAGNAGDTGGLWPAQRRQQRLRSGHPGARL